MLDLILRGARAWLENQQATGTVDLAIKSGRIIQIASQIDARARQELLVDGRVVIPGLNNCHSHLDKAFMGHHPAENYDVSTALEAWRLASRTLSIEDIKRRARRALNLAIRDGTTTIRSCVDVAPHIGLTSAEALLTVREEYEHMIDIQLVAFPQVGLVSAPGTADLIREALRMGVDIVGGMPHVEGDRRAHIDLVFELALEFDRDIDMSIDSSIPIDGGDPRTLDLKYYAEKALREGYQGRVTAHHVCALGALEPESAAALIELVKEAGMAIVANPTSNLYTQGRLDRRDIRRGVTRVKDLLKGGVKVGLGTDNLDDIYMPQINMDMLREAYVASCAAHLGTRRELDSLLGIVTYGAAQVLRIAAHYGIGKDRVADLVVLDTREPAEAITAQVPKLYVIKRGVIVATNRVYTELFTGR